MEGSLRLELLRARSQRRDVTQAALNASRNARDNMDEMLSAGNPVRDSMSRAFPGD